MSTETLIEFPAQLSVKAMGLNTDDFEAFISALVLPLIDSQGASITTVASKESKYLSVSVHFTATDLAQLHDVYEVLRNESRVLYTL